MSTSLGTVTSGHVDRLDGDMDVRFIALAALLSNPRVGRALITLHADDERLVRRVIESPYQLGNIKAFLSRDGSGSRLIDLARARIAEARVAVNPRLVIEAGTDGSVGTTGFGAWAYVTDHGQCRVGTVSPKVVLAELQGIRKLLRAVSNHQLAGRQLRIHTDSRDALAWIHAAKHPEHVQRRFWRSGVPWCMALEIAHLSGPAVSFHWVPGHRGHLLNETADRLAVAARKAYNRGLTSIDVRQTLSSFGDRASLLRTNRGLLRIRT